ncbi:MAG: hypothetical protein JXC85_05735 [Candidatus Aenigmarchaeota archaeon]|nr:hypothetical protein [Candidatus Aenigmarchaeota archaeon]
MGIKCPRCKSSQTQASEPGKMFCRSCSYSWKPYKHRGKKMRTIGDGLIFPRKKVMPGARTQTIGDGLIFPKKRVKKPKKKDTFWF